MPTLEELNKLYATDSINFQVGEGGLPKCTITHPNATAEFYLNGGHMTHFQPTEHQPVLWMSSESKFEAGKPIRGGIPICWPWFGQAVEENRPQHGFARNTNWTVVETQETVDFVAIELKIESNAETKSIWPHSFELKLRFEIGKKLSIELETRNTGAASFRIGTAIHSYFNVTDASNIELSGLDQVDYIDQLDNNLPKQQQGEIKIREEIDRVYIESGHQVSIVDRTMNRVIKIKKSGSQSTVVWNPWISKANRMADFPDDGYRTMVCVETANAFTDVREIAPDEQHVIMQKISVA